MTIIRTGKDERSEERRLLDEAILIRSEAHRMLDVADPTPDVDTMTHVAACVPCLEYLEAHAVICEDGKKLLERC